MRVVAYRNDTDAENKLDKRVDTILAFRITRKESDGNITILWKELKEQKAPKIIFPKDEK